MRSLVAVVEAAGTGPLEAEVFGDAAPSAVAQALSALTSSVTGKAVRGGLWYQASVAAVAGVVTEDGRELVVRAYRPSTGRAFIDGVVRVQAHLAGHGFPCAAPLGDPVVINGVFGRAEMLLADPGPRRFHHEDMARSAHGLAELVRLTAEVEPAGLTSNPMALPDSELYPPPHSPVFDFGATAWGAEWIDEIAAAARAAMTDGEDVISHGDWTARNIRLGPSGLLCVYDLESLQYWPEPTALGVAAATWPSLGEADDPLAPSAAEVEHYVHSYEQGRGIQLSAAERRSAHAAAVYALAYTARCEHAREPGIRTGRASGRLAQDDGLRSLIG